MLGGLFIAVPAANASITVTGGSADLNFYYESAEQRWDVVLRGKGSTVASGLDNPYAGFDGIVGLGTDFEFDTIQINVTSPAIRTVNGIDYLLTPASGSGFHATGSDPDLGIRTRLRENFDPGNEPNVDQFDSMRLTLDWAASSVPAGAEFIMLRFDPEGDPLTPLYDTANSDFSHDWDNWGHTHWHWGFSEEGDYSLVFDVQGIGGEYGDTPVTSGVTTVNFTVVPEPGAALLSVSALAALAFRRRRIRIQP